MTALVGSVAAVFTAIYYYGFDFEKVGDGVFPPETRDAHDCVSVDGTSKGGVRLGASAVKHSGAANTYACAQDEESSDCASQDSPSKKCAKSYAAVDCNNNSPQPPRIYGTDPMSTGQPEECGQNATRRATSQQQSHPLPQEMAMECTDGSTQTEHVEPCDDLNAEPTVLSSLSPALNIVAPLDQKRLNDFLKNEGSSGMCVVHAIDVLLEIIRENGGKGDNNEVILSKPLGREMLARFETALEGLRLLTTFWPTERCVSWEMVYKPVSEFRLTNRHGGCISLAKYYEAKHGVSLRYPALPSVRTVPDQKIPIPVELLVITDLPTRIVDSIDLAVSYPPQCYA